ncbi:PREDICTED: golgin subfamily A member 2-like, partial [Dipodomys ordii]|uniref:Golgin subfamily A member 2-like n=1 Tax=Dipodomys ordii TaxID=10020 RepID=A0A1S3G764_DIPOR
LAAARKNLMQYHERSSLAGPAGAKKIYVPSPHPVTINTASVQGHDTDLRLNTMAGLESLKHLLEKLTSFVSDTTFDQDRENLPCSEMMEDLEDLYEGLAEALDTCCKTNLITKEQFEHRPGPHSAGSSSDFRGDAGSCHQPAVFPSEEQLLALELASKMCNEQAEAHIHQILETLIHNQSTIRDALRENQHFRNQLAQLQDGLGKLSSHNTQLTSTLQAEQHTKKQLAKQLEQLQQEVLQGRREIQSVNKNLQQTQEQLTATMQQNQQLQAQVSLLALPAGSETEETKDDEAARLTLTIPESTDSREDIITFFSEAQTSSDAERTRLGHQLRQQKLLCQYMAQLAALNHTRPEQEALAPHWGG